ncbi:ABC transporter substrate-binding protein [Elioraea tepidiphila]|uniref:ABC transporter substrate-binding protein n=1 Tax=Elioraea tepidiphila TaxID=457934 RepID=UPI00035DFFB2|nr:ABC transporter substrate-binding protein [Elioraea tepidiphila]
MIAPAIAAVVALLALPVQAQTMRWATDRPLATLDPHATADAFTLGVLGNIHEGLVRRTPDLALEPALAVEWRAVEPLVWRFALREGVAFHDGSPFSAEDVAFSIARAQANPAGRRGRVATIAAVRVVDPHTVELVTRAPDPLLPQRLDTVLVLSRAAPSTVAGEANGTGPFRLDAHAPERTTRLTRNTAWWDRERGMIVHVELWPIPSAAARLAALPAGDIDLVTTIPPEAVAQLRDRQGVVVVEGPALRTVMLGFDIGPVAGPGTNPLADGRVRRAIAHAIDGETLRKEVMGGAALRAGLPWGPGVFGHRPEEDRGPVFDLDRARALLAEAALPAGFPLRLDCPQGRALHDAALCAALAPMLAKLGIRLTVNVIPDAAYDAALARREARAFLLAWSAEPPEAGQTLAALAHARDPAGPFGHTNHTGYDRAELNGLIAALAGEFAPARRQALIDQAAAMLRADAVYLPLHHEVLTWAHRDRIRVVQRPDGVVVLNAITLP